MIDTGSSMIYLPDDVTTGFYDSVSIHTPRIVDVCWPGTIWNRFQVHEVPKVNSGAVRWTLLAMSTLLTRCILFSRTLLLSLRRQPHALPFFCWAKVRVPRGRLQHGTSLWGQQVRWHFVRLILQWFDSTYSSECLGGIVSLGSGFPSNMAIIGEYPHGSWNEPSWLTQYEGDVFLKSCAYIRSIWQSSVWHSSQGIRSTTILAPGLGLRRVLIINLSLSAVNGNSRNLKTYHGGISCVHDQLRFTKSIL